MSQPARLIGQSFLAFWLGLCVLRPAAANQSFTVQGQAAFESATATTSKVRGRLLIIGGGTIPAAIIQRIISLAGGPEARIVIFPHAS